MGYLIELSVNVNKISNISGIKKALFDKADECNVERYYSFYEFMGKNRKMYRNHCVLSFTFEEYEELIIHFINYVKTFSGVNIESLGYDQLVFKLMYASRKYLRLMDKFQAQKYLEDKKKGKLHNQDSIILKAILKKK